ncbi:hypothetical protein [Parvimonas sp. C2]|uniref:hypothetical protein n=1 Tax=Parvimonas sp. C2 TaxID=3110692 RepID=UPI002B4A4A4E|nr:hypothetical protein [Parvimonas sp. C2]MEB3072658.1 hypothetical protein [Parvimonas sp. C2]
MKCKRRIVLLLAFMIGILPAVSSLNESRIYAQEDWSGALPYYLKVEIDKLYDELTPEQQEFLRKSSIQNTKAALYTLNVLAGMVHGNPTASAMISILIGRLMALVD